MIKFLIKNPDVDGKIFKVAVKGFGGDTSNTLFTGNRYFGWGEI